MTALRPRRIRLVAELGKANAIALVWACRVRADGHAACVTRSLVWRHPTASTQGRAKTRRRNWGRPSGSRLGRPPERLPDPSDVRTIRWRQHTRRGETIPALRWL